MPKLTEGARSAEAFRERRRARVKTILTILAALVLAPLTAVAGMAVPGNGYYLSGTLIVLYAIVPFFVSFEGRRPTAREIAVVAVLTALAVAARAAFIWVPHFKPMAAVWPSALRPAFWWAPSLCWPPICCSPRAPGRPGRCSPLEWRGSWQGCLPTPVCSRERTFPGRVVLRWQPWGSCLLWGSWVPFWIRPRSSIFPQPPRRSWPRWCTSPACR